MVDYFSLIPHVSESVNDTLKNYYAHRLDIQGVQNHIHEKAEVILRYIVKKFSC